MKENARKTNFMGRLLREIAGRHYRPGGTVASAIQAAIASAASFRTSASLRPVRASTWKEWSASSN
jgi:hypothetical protein